MLTAGWLQFRRLENRIIETLDQHYLNITTPGREAYLLSEDEIFSVPYMAAKLSAEATIQTARSSIVEAQAALANATTNLAYTTITAPMTTPPSLARKKNWAEALSGELVRAIARTPGA